MTAARVNLWPPLPPDVYARAAARELPFPFTDGSCVLFARGRQALWLGAIGLGVRTGDEVLVPAYHCGSEVEALTRSGATCVFYEATETLEPDEAVLDRLVTPRTRALFLIHYLGFPQDARRWRRWCDERGLLLIEDCAHAWLASADGRPVGALGDLAIFSFYKSLPLPDGAAVVSVGRTPRPSAPPNAALVPLARKHAAWFLRRLRCRRERFLRRPLRAAEHEFALEKPVPPAPASLFLLRRLTTPDVAVRRRTNYSLLLDEFAHRVPSAFAKLPDGASPLVFPLEVEGDAIERIRARGIAAEPLWPLLHPLLPADDFPAAVAWHRRFVALPVHQELTPSDVEDIAAAVRGRSRPRNAFHFERIETVDAISDEWSALAASSRNIFSTPEWLSLWWRHFSGDRTLSLVACRTGAGRLVAILPFYRSTRGVRILRFLGHGPSDELGPICDVADRRAAARALRSYLRDQRGWDLFLADALPADQPWSALLGGRTLRSEPSPVLKFNGGGWEDVVGSWSPKLRQRVSYDERRLAREHEVCFRLADDPVRLPADLDTLFTLHQARWEDQGSAFATTHSAFHRDFAATALRQEWLRLWFLEIDERPVAVWYGFRFSGIESHYQGGRDPGWSRFSVGSVLLAHTIRRSLEDGMDEYRFLRGGEAYKYRFANHDAHVETIAVANGVAGTAALTARAAARRFFG